MRREERGEARDSNRRWPECWHAVGKSVGRCGGLPSHHTTSQRSALLVRAHQCCVDDFACTSHVRTAALTDNSCCESCPEFS